MSADARQRVLAIARDLLEADALAATSIELLRERAGVSNGSFFHHFPSRDALIGELYLEALRGYHHEIEAELVDDPPARSGIDAAIRAHLSWVTVQDALGRLLEGPTPLHPDLQRRRDDENDRFASVLDRWRRSLIDRHEIVDVDNDVFIAVVVGPARIVGRNWLHRRRPTTPTDHADQLIELATRSLLTDPRA